MAVAELPRLQKPVLDVAVQDDNVGDDPVTGSPADGHDTPLDRVEFVVVDVETTGGSPSANSLTEVAAARYRGGELLGTYRTFVRPDHTIPAFITDLTGIDDALVADAPRVEAILPSLLEFVGRSVLVGHNLRFDLSFLDHALVASGRDPLQNLRVDTLALARRLVRDEVDNCKLGTLAASLRLPNRPSHRALSDVLATGDLLHALLERAGSFGILDLGGLLDLPGLLDHPQGAKLRLAVRLPRRPGAYWFTDATGHVLHVGSAPDLQAAVRSYFAADRRRAVGRLLRQLHTIHSRVTHGPLSAAVLEGRLAGAWLPSFDRHGRPHRRPVVHSGTPGRSMGARVARRGRRGMWTAEQLGSDPVELMGTLADEVRELSGQQRYEEAAALRDEAGRLRSLLDRHRQVTALVDAGRLVLAVEGEGEVVLDRGLWTGSHGPDPEHVAVRPVDHDAERAVVSQWLAKHPGAVRVLEVGAPEGLAMPASRIPDLAELCGRPPTDPGP